jgi:hypothetical protein
MYKSVWEHIYLVSRIRLIGGISREEADVADVADVANIMEQCSLFLPLQRGAGPLALMLWPDWVT